MYDVHQLILTLIPSTQNTNNKELLTWSGAYPNPTLQLAVNRKETKLYSGLNKGSGMFFRNI